MATVTSELERQSPAKTRLIDCDTHFWQPVELWIDYVDPAYRQAVLDLGLQTIDPAKLKLATAGVEPGHKDGIRATIESRNIRGGDYPDARLEWMDAEGIETCFIYAGMAQVAYNPNAQLAAAACRALNRWAADFAAHAPDRLKPCMLLPWHEPDLAVRELEHALSLGMRVAFSTPTPSVNHRWSSLAYDPLWRELEAASVVMTFHEFTKLPGTPNNIVRGSYQDVHTLLYLCGHTLEAQLSLMDLMCGGVFNRFPRLKLGFVEAHTAWVPGWLALLDQMWGRNLSGFKDLSAWGDTTLRPTDLFRRQGFIVAFPDDFWIDRTVAEIGAENVVLGSDYPHPQTRYHLAETFKNSYGRLDARQQRLILGENAVRIYGL